MYLTIDEVRKLAETECEYSQIKAAFLFGCLTGLWRSDILKLKWEDVFFSTRKFYPYYIQTEENKRTGIS